MKINLVVYVYTPYVSFYVNSSMSSFLVSFMGASSVGFSMGLFLFTKGKFLTNSFIQSKVNIIYSDISWASSEKTEQVKLPR